MVARILKPGFRRYSQDNILPYPDGNNNYSHNPMPDHYLDYTP
jgi:hypothetical protein